MRFKRTKVKIDEFLPEYSYTKEPNREWLCNVINTLITDDFKKFIKINIEKRNKELISSQNLGINATSEFNEIFKKSQPISTAKEKSHFLTRTQKLTKDQHKVIAIEEEKKKFRARLICLKKN